MSNYLANETSPYLLQHKDNPVNWYPWGREAFEKAKNENKPVFLSIGYSTYPIINGRTTYYVCGDTKCLPPTNNLQDVL